MSPKTRFPTIQILIPAIGVLISSQAFALCNGLYEHVSAENQRVAEEYGARVYSQDSKRLKESFVYKVFRDSQIPGIGFAFDVVTTPHDEFNRNQIKESELVDDAIRQLAIRLWQDETQVIDVLRDAEYGATENKAFQALYAAVKRMSPGFTASIDDVASFVRAANWGEHFCLEKPETVFVKNRFGKTYPTELHALFSLVDIEDAVLNGSWSAKSDAVPADGSPRAPSTLSYPANPLTDRP